MLIYEEWAGQFESLNELLDYCRSTRQKLVATDITLLENTSFLGVYLQVDGNLYLNGHDVEFGGGVPQPIEAGQMGYDLPQYVNSIIRKTKTENVYVRGCQGIRLTINYCLPIIKLRMNDTDQFIAYSEFNFKTVGGIDIGNDAGVSGNNLLWCNENVFNLMRTTSFRIAGSYSHNMNRINGGCFEGASSISIETGHRNTFYDIRNEGTTLTSIYFGKGTCENIVYTAGYDIEVNDESGFNAVIPNALRNAKMLECSVLSMDRFTAGQFNGFKNLVATADGLGFKPKEYKTVNVIYETNYLENPENLLFCIDLNLKTGLGIGFKYLLYDANYNEVAEFRASGHSAYYVTTEATDLLDKTEGNYNLPGGVYVPNPNDHATLGIKADHVRVRGSVGHWQAYKEEALVNNYPTVKYVKFFLTSSEHQDILTDAEYYGLSISVYDLSGNYRLRYFNNI